MTRPALTWLALWLGIATSVAVGIVAGFLVLHLLVPDVTLAASRSSPPSPDANAMPDRVLAPANEAPTPSPMRRVALPPATAKPSPASIVLAARSGTRVAGTASWFASSAGVSAAGPELRAALGPGWRGAVVRVTGPAGSAVVVLLGDFMRADRLVDLDAAIFIRVCGPLELGLCRVAVTP